MGAHPTSAEPAKLDQDPPEEESGSRLRFALKVAAGALVVAIVAILLILRTWPPLNVVLSNSMEPTIKTGDVVVMQALDRAPKVGDIVAVNPTPEERKKYGYPDVVIHRIVKIVGGKATTKGDGRKQPDPFTTPTAQLKSHVIWWIPAAGRVINFFTSPLGLIWIGIGVVLLIVVPFFESQREAAERDEVAMESLEEMRGEIDAMSKELLLETEIRPRAPPPGQNAEGEVEAASELAEMRETMREVVAAVGEYGEHLQSHTEILRAMSSASQQLADTVGELRDVMDRRGPDQATMRARAIAVRMRFKDPGDALRLAEVDDGLDDSAIERELRRLAEAKPYLLRRFNPS
jgi:signal peptidase I